MLKQQGTSESGLETAMQRAAREARDEFNAFTWP